MMNTPQEGELASGQLSQSSFGEFAPGTTAFENYRVICKVGEGGMGVVYKATNILLDRISALKVMTVDSWSSTDVVRFQNEARTLSRLEHTNIARLFDFGIGEGQRPYLSMEFVEGGSLQESIDKNGPLPIDLFFEVFIQICEGLAHAHDKGVVHRDVKTSNIMLSIDDNGALRAVLLDFGVAKMSSDDNGGQLTKAGGMIGSPLYISPEQIVGGSVSAKSDIYSLSCVMFCALTGAPPFAAETVLETLSLHREGEIPIEQLEAVEGIFPELCDLIAMGLSKLPEHRPKSATEIAEKLEELSAQLPDSESGAERELENGKRPVFATFSGTDREGLSDRAAQMLSETDTRKIPVDPNRSKSRTLVYVSAAIVVVCIVFVFVGNILVPTKELRNREAMPKVSPAHDVIGRQSIMDPKLDPEFNALTRITEKPLEKYFNGPRTRNPIELTSLHEADSARKHSMPTKAELVSAIAEYKTQIKQTGAVEPPDATLARAYVGLYDCSLKLEQYEKLQDLEKQILKYCPKGQVANEAFLLFKTASDAFGKRENPREAVRSMEAAEELLKRNEYKDQFQIGNLELTIGSTYTNLGEYTRAKRWLESARARLEKCAPNSLTHTISLIRLGATQRRMKDYKRAIVNLRAAEKSLAKLVDQKEKMLYLGHIYYQWSSVLYETQKYEEAESKIQKGLVVGDEKTKIMLTRLLKEVREAVARSHSGDPQKVTQ